MKQSNYQEQWEQFDSALRAQRQFFMAGAIIFLVLAASMAKAQEDNEAALHLIADKQLSDPVFNAKVKADLVRALLATDVLKSRDEMDALEDSSAEEVAKVLADAKVDPKKITDPVVIAAVKQSAGIAARSIEAARDMQAVTITDDNVKMKAALIKMSKRKLKNPILLAYARAPFMIALVEAGLIDTRDDSLVKDAKLKKLAKIVKKAKLNPEDMLDSDAAMAVRLAHQVSKGDKKATRYLAASKFVAMGRLKAVEMKFMTGKAQAALQQELKNAITNVGAGGAWRVKETHTWRRGSNRWRHIPGKKLVLPKNMTSQAIAQEVLNFRKKQPRGCWHRSWRKRRYYQSRGRCWMSIYGSKQGATASALLEDMAGLAAGDEAIGLDVMATTRVFEAEKAGDLKRKLGGVKLSDPVFNDKVKANLISALLATKLLKTQAEVDELQDSSAQEVAKILADGKVDPDDWVGSPVVMMAVKQSSGIAAGSSSAARRLQVTSIADYNAKIAKAVLEMGELKLKDPLLQARAKIPLLIALIEGEIIESTTDAKVDGLSTKSVAKMVVVAELKRLLPSMKEDMAMKAVRLANRVAKGKADSTRELAAAFKVQFEAREEDILHTLQSKTLKDPKFLSEVQEILVSVLLQGDVVQDKSDPQVYGKTLKDVATLLVSANEPIVKRGVKKQKFQFDNTNIVVAKALLVSSRLANADNNAARELVAAYTAVKFAAIKQALASLKDVTLSDPVFADSVKQALRLALLRNGVKKEITLDSLARTSAEKCFCLRVTFCTEHR